MAVPVGDTEGAGGRISAAAADWGISLFGALIALVVTVVSLVFGVDGPLSIAIGVAGIAVSLLLETLQKLNELRDKNDRNHEADSRRLGLLAAKVSAASDSMTLNGRLRELGVFQSEIERLLRLAGNVQEADLNPVISDQSVAILRAATDALAPLEQSRLQLDFSYSNLLLDVMRGAETEVLGTSPSDAEDLWWTLPLYEEYLQIQQRLVNEKSVKITRIFMSATLDARLLAIMRREESIGINVRYVATGRIHKELVEAYVIFDTKLLHRTIPTVDRDDDNFFSQNISDVRDYISRFHRVLPFSQALDELAFGES